MYTFERKEKTELRMSILRVIQFYFLVKNMLIKL